MRDDERVELTVTGEVWYWRGPAPFHFVTVPDPQSAAIEAASGLVTYGWGMIPVRAQLSGTHWTTSLWPKDGQYIVPLKTSVRRETGVELGDTVTVQLTVDT